MRTFLELSRIKQDLIILKGKWSLSCEFFLRVFIFCTYFAILTKQIV